jgi:hypothetical protein
VSQTIWTQCGAKANFRKLDLDAWRVVENQYQFSTRKLVDSSEEQAILEELIETVKPINPLGPEWSSLHFLLFTPFRYPPLKYGSRFGVRHEQGIWYGSLSVETALCEAAYLRLRLLNDTAAHIQSAVNLTVFNIGLYSSKAIDLTKSPFHGYTAEISDKTTYRASQELGASMRGDGVEFFKYESARDPKKGANVGVFSPKAFASKSPKPSDFQMWHCYSDKNQVDMRLNSFWEIRSFRFPKSMFQVGKLFPIPKS